MFWQLLAPLQRPCFALICHPSVHILSPMEPQHPGHFQTNKAVKDLMTNKDQHFTRYCGHNNKVFSIMQMLVPVFGRMAFQQLLYPLIVDQELLKSMIRWSGGYEYG